MLLTTQDDPDRNGAPLFQIAVSSATETGNKPWYVEECSGTMTTAYSSGQGGSAEHDIVRHLILLASFYYSLFILSRSARIYIMDAPVITRVHRQRHP